MEAETKLSCELEFVGHGADWELAPRKALGAITIVMLIVIVGVPTVGVTALMHVAPLWARVVIPIVVGVPTLSIVIAAFVNYKTEIAKGPLVVVRGDVVDLPRHRLKLSRQQLLGIRIEIGGLESLFAKHLRMSGLTIEYHTPETDEAKSVTLLEDFAAGSRSANMRLARGLSERLAVPWREA
jgi:hypothetical protein